MGTFLTVVLWLGCIAWGGKIGWSKHRLICGMMLGGFLLFAGVAAIALMPTHDPNAYPYALPWWQRKHQRKSTSKGRHAVTAPNPTDAATGTGWPTQPPTHTAKHAR
jgi:hypothetical protein